LLTDIFSSLFDIGKIISSSLSIVAAMIFSRILEMRISKKNEDILRKKFELNEILGKKEYFFVVIFHSAWFLSLFVELFINQEPLLCELHPILGLTLFLCLLCAQVLRWESIRTLKENWTTKIFSYTGQHYLASGIYRYFKHPSYFAVAIEFIALPWLLQAYSTLFIFSFFNAFILRRRILAENFILRKESSC
jgi:methyltransferase